jgi:hypothetical protein
MLKNFEENTIKIIVLMMPHLYVQSSAIKYISVIIFCLISKKKTILQGPFPKKKTILQGLNQNWAYLQGPKTIKKKLQGLKPKLSIFAGTKNYKKKICRD